MSRYPHNGCCPWGQLHPTTLNSTPLHNPRLTTPHHTKYTLPTSRLTSPHRTISKATATVLVDNVKHQEDGGRSQGDLQIIVAWCGVAWCGDPHRFTPQDALPAVCFRSRASHDRTWSVVPDRHHLSQAGRKQVQRVYHLHLGQLGPCGFARLEFGIVPLCPHHPATVTQFLWPNRSQIQRSSEVHKLCLQ